MEKPFYDVDDALEAASGKSVSELMALHGLEGFRDLETKTLREIMDRESGCVLATGGGTLNRPNNRFYVKKFGHVVWLEAKPETIWNRIKHKPYVAPLFYTRNDPLSAIRDELLRKHHYFAQIADIRINVDGKTAHQIAAEISASLSIFAIR